MLKQLIFLVGLSFFLTATSVSAEEASLNISDCTGVKSVQYQVPSGSTSTIRVTTQSDVTGEGILSKLDANGAVVRSVRAPIGLRTVLFEGISEGTWIFCSDPGEIAVNTIALADEPSGFATVALGTGGIVGGMVALASGGTSSMSRNSQSAPASSIETAGNGTSSGVGGPKGVGGAASNPCFIGDDVVPMSPFS